MKFESPLIRGTLLKRYNRFLSDIRLNSGEIVKAHCPNSGSMKGVNVPESEVMVSYCPDPRRTLKYTWEMINISSDWVGINTQIPNKITAEALKEGLIPAFREYKSFRREVTISVDTRIDFVLDGNPPMMLEVKNVTLVENGAAKFPDSVTERGQKHLYHLIENVQAGGKSAMLYVIQHHGGHVFTTADEIDPVYCYVLREAMLAGVQIEAWKAKVTTAEIKIIEKVPIDL